MDYKSRLFTVLIAILLICVFGSLLIITPARAQTPLPTLSVASPSNDLCEGAEITLTVHIADVVDLFGYDVSLNYDPDVIEVLSLANSGWLSSASQVSSRIDNGIGFLEFAVTKTSGSGISGSGDLVNIRVRVKAPAETIQFTFITTGVFPTEIVNSSVESMPYLIGETGNILTHACIIHFPESTIVRCEGSVIPVRVEDVYDLYAYGVDITYDPNVIQVTNVTPDPSFISPDYTVINYSTPGIISIDVTQFAKEPVNGSGVLFNIEVQMVIPNTISQLTITPDSLLSDRNGFIIPATIVNRDIYTYSCDPNAVELMSFDVVRKKIKAFLTWETASELDNVGFNIYRAGRLDGTLKKINKELIPAQAVGTMMGAEYSYIDKPLKPWKTYYYWLESVDLNGETSLTGPIEAAPPPKK